MAVSEQELKSSSMTKVKKLVTDFNDLLSKHIELFSYEIKNETILSSKILMAIVFSAIIAYTGFIFLGIFFVLMLGLFIPMVASAMIVTSLYILGSVALLFMAKRYLEQIKQGNESVRSQIMKTMESARKWLTDLK